MRIVAGLAIALLARVSYAAPAISWGARVTGLRLGAELGPDNLRVLIGNTGITPLDLLLGANPGRPIYNLKFTATSPGGKPYDLLDVNALTAAPVSGLVLPVTVTLAPGAIYALTFAEKKLICVIDRKEITLDTLLQLRFSVRVSFEMDAKSAQWGHLARPWMGAISSGAVTRP